MKISNQEAINIIMDEVKVETIKQGIALNMAASALEEYLEWTPINNPQEELPKESLLWVTINANFNTYVDLISYDVSGWNQDVSHVIAYKPYHKPKAYHKEEF